MTDGPDDESTDVDGPVVADVVHPAPTGGALPLVLAAASAVAMHLLGRPDAGV